MERRAQLFKSLIMQLFMVMFFVSAPKFVDIVFSLSSSEQTTESSAASESQTYDPNNVDLSAVNLAEPLKKSLKFVQGVAVTFGTLGILFTGIRIVFDGESVTRRSSSEPIRARRQQEVPQPSVADALEGMLVSQDTSPPVTSVPTQVGTGLELGKSQHSLKVEEDINSSPATRVIRENNSNSVIEEPADTSSGEVKRVIRG
ncbi:hypothetical protein EHV15_35035 [Paenibacillus oralis]|uniref:Uncharacterized protein n=1 Tax=Paenibacillus oralis TaxID=2490856 RepID=A0A3P3T9T6_9BACL|nr:hypothetical protein [Paenibacillus oralis]RRJ54806.1 hypothetical protein EHV15_35035 [Paenibacillus oralis]